MSGDSSRHRSKPSFRIDFITDPPLSLFASTKVRTLYLRASNSDVTFIRETLAFHLMISGGAAAPLVEFISLSFAGDFFGLYLAVQSVESLLDPVYELNTQSMMFKVVWPSFAWQDSSTLQHNSTVFQQFLPDNLDQSDSLAPLLEEIGASSLNFTEFGLML